MPTPYSEDLRLHVVNAVESRKSTREVATLFQVSSSFVSAIHLCWKQKGHVHAKHIGGYRRAVLEPYEDAIKVQLADKPSMTLRELQFWLESEQSLSLSISAIDKFLRQQLGYRYKKTVVASEQPRDDVATAREQWQAWQKICNVLKLVFLDETSNSIDMIRCYVHALGGARCEDDAPADHWQTLTFIAGLRVDRLTAPWCLNQAMHGDAFKEYCRSQLGPTLSPGDIVICDNLSAHKVADVQELIEARGATLNTCRRIVLT